MTGKQSRLPPDSNKAERRQKQAGNNEVTTRQDRARWQDREGSWGPSRFAVLAQDLPPSQRRGAWLSVSPLSQNLGRSPKSSALVCADGVPAFALLRSGCEFPNQAKENNMAINVGGNSGDPSVGEVNGQLLGLCESGCLL